MTRCDGSRLQKCWRKCIAWLVRGCKADAIPMIQPTRHSDTMPYTMKQRAGSCQIANHTMPSWFSSCLRPKAGTDASRQVERHEASGPNSCSNTAVLCDQQATETVKPLDEGVLSKKKGTATCTQENIVNSVSSPVPAVSTNKQLNQLSNAKLSKDSLLISALHDAPEIVSSRQSSKQSLGPATEHATAQAHCSKKTFTNSPTAVYPYSTSAIESTGVGLPPILPGQLVLNSESGQNETGCLIEQYVRSSSNVDKAHSHQQPLQNSSYTALMQEATDCNSLSTVALVTSPKSTLKRSKTADPAMLSGDESNKAAGSELDNGNNLIHLPRAALAARNLAVCSTTRCATVSSRSRASLLLRLQATPSSPNLTVKQDTSSSTLCIDVLQFATAVQDLNVQLGASPSKRNSSLGLYK